MAINETFVYHIYRQEENRLIVILCQRERKCRCVKGEGWGGGGIRKKLKESIGQFKS